jgi:hypothetical protein
MWPYVIFFPHCTTGSGINSILAVTTLRQVRQMPHPEIGDFFYIINLYSDRNDIHWMNSFNVYGYRLKSTDTI